MSKDSRTVLANKELQAIATAIGVDPHGAQDSAELGGLRYGTVVLPRGLRRGMWVDLGEGDVRAIRRLAAPGPRAGGRDEAAGAAGPRRDSAR